MASFKSLDGGLLSFPVPLSNERLEALRLIEAPHKDFNTVRRFLESGDFVLVLAALYVIETSEQPVPDELIEPVAVHLKNEFVENEAIRALGNMGKPAIKVLEKYSDTIGANYLKAAEAALKIMLKGITRGERNGLLNKLAKTKRLVDLLPESVDFSPRHHKKYIESFLGRAAAVEQVKDVIADLPSDKKEAVNILTLWANHEYPEVRAEAAKALGDTEKSALDILEKLISGILMYIRTQRIPGSGFM